MTEVTTLGAAAGAVVERVAARREADQEIGAMLSMIERAARDPAVDVEKLERLFLMKERMEKDAARKAFNTALAAAKAELPAIVKSRKVDFTTQKGRTRYDYEDFAGIAKAVDPVLAKHGLQYRFKSEQAGNKLRVTCVLFHEAGHTEDTTLEAVEDHSGNKNGIQAIGSSSVYLQRYTLKLALGIAASADDDGRAVAGTGRNIEALRAEGEQIAAENGAAALQVWWTKALTQDDRKALGAETITALKKIAALTAAMEVAQ